MAEHEQNAAENDGLAHAEPAIGEQATDDRHRVDEATVGTDQVVAVVVRKEVVLGQVKQQQRLHSVEREALPHFGEEADVESLRVAEQLVGASGDIYGDGGHSGDPATTGDAV